MTERTYNIQCKLKQYADEREGRSNYIYSILNRREIAEENIELVYDFLATAVAWSHIYAYRVDYTAMEANQEAFHIKQVGDSHHFRDHELVQLFIKKSVAILMQQDGKWMALHPIYRCSHDEIKAILSMSEEAQLNILDKWIVELIQQMDNGHLELFEVHADIAPYLSIFGDILSFANSGTLYCGFCGTNLVAEEFKIKDGKFYFELISYRRKGLPKIDCTKGLAGMTIKWPISIPSGKLMFADWFRTDDNVFSRIVKDEDKDSINYPYGRVKNSEHMAKFQCAHGSVGNERTVLYRVDGGVIIGAISDQDDLKDRMYGEVLDEMEMAIWADEKDEAVRDQRLDSLEEDAEEETNRRISVLDIKELEQLGSICTDLWAYTLMDKDIFKDMMKQAGVVITKDYITRETTYAGGDHPSMVSIPKGMYEHYYLSEFSVEDALNVLPEHIRVQLEGCHLYRLMGALVKV